MGRDVTMHFVFSGIHLRQEDIKLIIERKLLYVYDMVRRTITFLFAMYNMYIFYELYSLILVTPLIV